MVMLGPHAATRPGDFGAATAEVALVASIVATAKAASRDLLVTGCSTRHVVVAGGLTIPDRIPKTSDLILTLTDRCLELDDGRRRLAVGSARHA